MSWRTLRLVCVNGVLVLSAAAGCGGSASTPGAGIKANAGGGGSGGHSGSGSVARAGNAGAPAGPASVACGSKTCAALTTPIPDLVVPACCADEGTSHCGLDSSVLETFGATFGEACQPLAQPGTLDKACPNSAAAPVQGTGATITLAGCCRPDHTCGYDINTVGGVLRVGLGCVDATPFLGGETPQSCGEAGAAGAGGESGGGAEAGGAGDSSAGGDSSSGGAGVGGELSGGAAGVGGNPSFAGAGVGGALGGGTGGTGG